MKSFVFGLLVLYFTGSLARFLWSPAEKRQISCDHSVMEQCFQPLVELNPFNGSKLDAEILEQRCSLLDSSKDCVINYNNMCKDSDVGSINTQAVQNIVGYVCSAEGKDVLLTESECLPNNDNMNHCSDVMMQELQQAGLEPQDTKAVCRRTKNFVVCMVKTMRADCSETAVNLVRNLVSSLILPITSGKGCDNQAVVVRDLVKLIARRK